MLKKDNGNVLISMVIVVMAAVSGIVFTSIANRDCVFTNYQLNAVQQTHMVRSEILRGFQGMLKMSTNNDNGALPIRKIEMDNGASKTTYALKTEIRCVRDNGSDYHGTLHQVISTAKTFQCPASLADYNKSHKKCPVECSAIRTYTAETYASFSDLTKTNASVNNDYIYFYGSDEIWGRVHSNTDIWLKSYFGWPVFHDHVSTAGQIRYFGGPPDEDEVFLSGYTENAREIIFNNRAEEIRRNGLRPFLEQANSPKRIVYVRLMGLSYDVLFGDVYETEAVPYIVYDSYPPMGEIGDSIGINKVTFYDTLWSKGPSGLVPTGSSVFVPHELWIKGTVSGAQTWCSSKDIYLVDDIIYQNTPVGENPDGSDDAPMNTIDYMGIVSEKSIYIQYGLSDEYEGGHRRHYNCDDINIYAALCALGDGDETSQRNGVFTYQYQYTHHSTPTYTEFSVTYEYPDLHVCWYPPQGDQLWPMPVNRAIYSGVTGDDYAPDYPFYNPLWPEEEPIRMRGTIHLYGSVAQVRRGFTHRSGSDPMDSSEYWDMDNFVYGNHAWGRESINGTTSVGASGYNKDYHYDYRFQTCPPPDFPPVKRGNFSNAYHEVSYNFVESPGNF